MCADDCDGDDDEMRMRDDASNFFDRGIFTQQHSIHSIHSNTAIFNFSVFV